MIGRPGGNASRDQWTASLLVVAALVCFNLGAALATAVVAHIGVLATAMLRTQFAAGVLLLGQGRGRMPRAPRAEWLLLGVAFACLNVCFYQAVSRAPLGVVVTVTFLGPLAIAIASSRRLLDGAWAILALLGVALLSPGLSSNVDPAGFFFSMLNAVALAAYILSAARVGRHPAPRQSLAWAMFTAGAVLLPVGLSGALDALDQPEFIIAAAAIALISSVIPYSLEIEALRRIRPSKFAVLQSLEPAIATTIGFVALGQTISSGQAAGIAMVLTACVFAMSRPTPPGPIV